MIITPSHLADIIGITSAPDGRHSNLPSQQQIQRMMLARTDEWAQNGPFWLEFAASYLPSFFRTFMNTDFDLSSYYFTWVSFHLFHIALGESFPRLGRVFPDELVASLDVQLRRIATLLQIGLDKSVGSNARSSLAHNLSVFGNSTEAYFAYQVHENPSCHPCVVVSREVQALLRSQVARVQGLGRYSFDMEGEEASLSVLIGREKILEIISTGSVTMKTDGTRFVTVYENVWWKCDIESFSYPKTSDAVAPCTGSVEEMRFCARCKAVRY